MVQSTKTATKTAEAKPEAKKPYALPSFTTEDAVIPQGRENGPSPFAETVRVQTERFVASQVEGGLEQAAQVLGFAVTGEEDQAAVVIRTKRGLAKASPKYTVRTKDTATASGVNITFWLAEKITQKRTPKEAAPAAPVPAASVVVGPVAAV